MGIYEEQVEHIRGTEPMEPDMREKLVDIQSVLYDLHDSGCNFRVHEGHLHIDEPTKETTITLHIPGVGTRCDRWCPAP